jgi:hypothetical protein
VRVILIIFFIILSGTFSYSQTIEGVVLDSKSDSAVYYAAVYINGTFIGTYTDATGKFRLDVTGFSSMPISVSAIGYYSAIIEKYDPEGKIRILLRPRIHELNEVVVTAREDKATLRNNRRIFRKQFLGETANSLRCRIGNMDDIVFKIDTAKHLLTAYTKNPILIDNKALGYRITCYLEKFEYGLPSNSLVLTGTFLFSEDKTTADKTRKKYETRRRSAYLGSRMHFLRALWNNELDSAGFELKTVNNELLTFSKIVRPASPHLTADSTRYIGNFSYCYINYYSKSLGSLMELRKDSVFFDRHGYFDPYGIDWGGVMSEQRVGDMLPFEYEPATTRK